MKSIAQQFLMHKITKRVFANFIDFAPILVIVFLIFYYFLGLDNIVMNYLDSPENAEFQSIFKKQRIIIYLFSFLISILYSIIMDCSITQGTIGKQMMGLKVTNYNGDRIDYKTSATRNFTKLICALPFFIGWLWVFFDQNKNSLHDKLSKTQLIDECI